MDFYETKYSPECEEIWGKYLQAKQDFETLMGYPPSFEAQDDLLELKSHLKGLEERAEARLVDPQEWYEAKSEIETLVSQIEKILESL